jgi:hypothetical protein
MKRKSSESALRAARTALRVDHLPAVRLATTRARTAESKLASLKGTNERETNSAMPHSPRRWRRDASPKSVCAPLGVFPNDRKPFTRLRSKSPCLPTHGWGYSHASPLGWSLSGPWGSSSSGPLGRPPNRWSFMSPLLWPVMP